VASTLFAVTTSFVVLISSCTTTTRYIANPSTPPPELDLRAISKDIEVALHYVIVPGGPGSWVEGAKWDEFVLTIKNLKRQDVSIAGVSLIDSRGVYVEARQIIHVQELDPTRSEAMQKEMEALPGSMVTGTATGIAQQTAISGIFSALPLGALGPVAGILPGVLAMAHGYPAISQSQLEVKDKETIQAEIEKRRLPLPANLSEGGALTGSVFFSRVQKPQALIVRYWTQQGSGAASTDGTSRIRIPLDKISSPPATPQAAQQP